MSSGTLAKDDIVVLAGYYFQQNITIFVTPNQSIIILNTTYDEKDPLFTIYL